MLNVLSEHSFKCVTRETRYHVYIGEILIRNLQSQVAELSRKTTISHKISKTNSSFRVKQRSTGKV